MTYILPVLYVIVSYTFFLLTGFFDNAIKLQILSILLHFDYQVRTNLVLPDRSIITIYIGSD